MNKMLVLACAIAAFAAMPAHAGLNLPGFAKAKPAETSADAPSGDALVTGFLASHGAVVSAQQALSSALGLKDQVAQLDAEAKRLGSGQLDVDAMKKSRALSDAAQARIAEALAAKPALTTQQREQFVVGLVEYGKALLGARRLLGQSQAFVSSVGANPMALMGKARVAMWVGKEMPGYVKGLGTTTRDVFAYAKSNGIKPPANATAALDGL